jgi:hypothetical protein
MRRTHYKVRLSDEESATLGQIAFSLGYTYGSKGSIAKLNQAIAAGDLIIIKKEFSKNFAQNP